ncbi:hypothetical protein [Halostella sp. PRR32]|uniref:hypothetical protein n=1 Tax=Halostella sp. PRR32 TaxID=3098147 RepID=UPI002B1E6881|nr:hypothetical protein [Halostella sp. PRR32]
MGIRVASNRYSHRVDSTVLQKSAIWLHFTPHLIAILFAIFLISTGRYVYWAFGTFIFFISASILSIFPFLRWLLRSLSPEVMLDTSINRINSDFLDRVENVVQEERAEIYKGQDRDQIRDIYRTVSYLDISEDDPVDMFMDIVRSRIIEDDTETVTALLDRYQDHVESQLENRYREFLVSHSDSQLVAWYLLSPFEDTFRIAVKEENHRVAEHVISLLRASIQSWAENIPKGVPEVFFRVFGAITVEYVSECDAGQANSIAEDYSKIASVVASDIDSPINEVTSAMAMTFVNSCLNFAISSLEEGYYEPASTINNGLRSIVEARLRFPSGNPDRTLLVMGLIGEQFGIEEAKSKKIVEIANEVSVMDQAEWTVTTLVTFKDKIEEYGNGYSFRDEHLDMVMREIDRVNEALEEKDSGIAERVDHDEDLVLQVIRGARLFRSPFSAEDLISELELSESKDKVEEICDSLEDIGAFEPRDDGQYVQSYDEF